MVSKHNMNKKLQDGAKRVPHYGLRKLSVGVASVLLGTTLFFCVSAQADTTTGQVGNGSDTESENDHANKLVDAKKVVLSQPTSTNILNTNNANNVQSEQNTDSLAENKSVVTTNPQSSMDNDGVSVTLNRTEYNPQDAQAIQMTTKIVAKAGDEVSFTFGKGAFKLPTYQGLSGNAGQTTISELSDGSTVITDKFTSAGTYSQTFSIQPYQYEFDIYNKLFSAGTTLVPVVIKKNHQEIGEVSFNQTIIPNMNPTFSRTQPSSRNVGKLAPNVDYQWTLVFNENPGTTSGTGLSTGPSKSINHGTTVTIPVPDGFVVNAEESAKLSSSTDFKWTVSQTGDRVIFVNNGGNSSNNSIVLVGHFTNELLDVDQQLTAKEKISIIQETGNGQQLKAQLPPFSDKLMRKKDDNPEGVSLNGNVYGAFGRSPYEKYPEGQVPLSNNPTEIVFWKYEVGNVSAFNLKNVTVNITLPDGMKATKLRLPSMYNDGEITYTLHRYVDANHPDEITTGVIGQADQILDFSNLAGHVRSIQLTLASLGAGVDYTASSYSTSDGFRVYGYVDQYYDNGKPVNVGDRLTSNLTFGTGTKGWHGDQYVVAKKTQPIKMHVNGFDDNRLPGANGAGYLQLWWDSVAQNADFANPIIYYVLPTNASFNNYYPINKNCKISSYKASDGRTIVKVQYLNTTNKDFRDGSLDYLYLNNQADLPNSFSDYKVFVVTPNGMQVSGQSKVQNADLKYVDNNSNAYEIGSGNWVIESAQGTQIAEQSQGNKNTDLTLSGESDNQGSKKMTFTGSVIIILITS